MKITSSHLTFDEGTVKSQTVVSVSENTDEDAVRASWEALDKNGFVGGGFRWMKGSSITFPSKDSFSFYTKEKGNDQRTTIFAVLVDRKRKDAFDIAGLRKQSRDHKFYEQYPLMGTFFQLMADRPLFEMVAGHTVRCIDLVKTKVDKWERKTIDGKVVNVNTREETDGYLPVFELVPNDEVPEPDADWPLPANK